MTAPVQVPANIDREDQLLGPLTARQLVVIGSAAVVVYGLWQALGPGNVIVFAVLSAPIALAATALAVGRRDGVGLDRLLIAAVRHRVQVRSAPSTVRAAAGDGVGRVVSTRAPVRGVRAVGPDRLGVVDLGSAGLAVVCSVAPANLSLRSATEQHTAVAGFARWLHSLAGPVQLVTRTRRLDLSVPIARLHAAAPRLAHPALTRAALAHAAHLHALDAHAELLDHEFLIVFRDPAPARDGTVSAVGDVLRRRAGEAVGMLGPLGLRVTPLSDAEAAAVLQRATAPASGLRRPPSPGRRADLDPPTVEIPRPVLPWLRSCPPATGDDLDHEHGFHCGPEGHPR